MTQLFLSLILLGATEPQSSGRPILLDFHSKTCGPCRQMRPAVDQLLNAGYPIKSIDIAEFPEKASRYRVDAVPTFIVVDSSGKALARVEGARPASELASLYREVQTKLQRDLAESEEDPADEGDPDDSRAEFAEGKTATPESAEIPYPWKTSVRIRIRLSNRMLEFGSGTIVHSTEEESIILTCGHIFRIEGRNQPPADRFPHRIEVDLFDGKLKGQTVGFADETHVGEALDYDLLNDVGLIRIRPGRRLDCSPVVPADWSPRRGAKMLTVGCSEGRDATAWNTSIVRERVDMENRQLRGSFSAVECEFAPKQGRSGGGLFTMDGYVAGVCDFADNQNGKGLYAPPRAIHRLLDKHRLSFVYNGEDRSGSRRLLAESRRTKSSVVGSKATIARAQSPSEDDFEPVTIPTPELLGIDPIPARVGARKPVSSSAVLSDRPHAWHAASKSKPGNPPVPGDGPSTLERNDESPAPARLDAAEDSNDFVVRNDPSDDDASRSKSDGGKPRRFRPVKPL